jgi:hypothetical protein
MRRRAPPGVHAMLLQSIGPMCRRSSHSIRTQSHSPRCLRLPSFFTWSPNPQLNDRRGHARRAALVP